MTVTILIILCLSGYWFNDILLKIRRNKLMDNDKIADITPANYVHIIMII